MSTLTCHLVTRNPAAAAAWDSSVLSAAETSRITPPGGRVMSIELRSGDSTRGAVDQHIRDVPHAEIVRLAAAAFSEGPG